MQRVSKGEMFCLSAYWAGHSFMWNSLHPIVLPAILIGFVPDAQKNTYLGLLTFAGLTIAMIVQPVAGTISDAWRSSWGRRRPLMLLGIVLTLPCLGLLSWCSTLTTLLLGYLGLQFASNIALASAQGLLPDRVPASQLGAGAATRTLIETAGLIAAALLAGRLLDPQAERPTAVMMVIGAVLVSAAAVTLIGTREAPAHRRESGRTPNARDSSGTTGMRLTASYWWLILGRFTFLLGICGIQGTAQYYLRDVLKADDPARQTGDLLASIALALVVFAPLGGRLTDRVRAKPVMIAGCLATAAGCLLLIVARSWTMLLISGGITGAGLGLFITANWALANRLAPAAESGKFLGLTNLATAGAGAVSRLEGPGVDLLNYLNPGAFWGYYAVFLFAAACSLATIPLIAHIRTEPLAAETDP
jgi:MFS family permease